MALALASLPDARVGLAPLLRRPLDELTQEPRAEAVQLAEVIAQQVRDADDLAQHVELALLPGVVAQPHRPAPAMAAQVGKLVLGEVALTLDAEDDLHVVIRAAAD